MGILFRCTVIAMLSASLPQITCALPAISHQKRYPGYDYGGSGSAIVERQASSLYVTTGVKTGSGVNGSLPLRLEVRELQKDPTMWTLYILGLDYLQRNKSQSHIESWYQLAGIHGRPFLAYDNVQALPGLQDSGYCQHVSILFPPWHRPYLALYEQIMYNAIQEIAQQYPEGDIRNKYVASALNFRIPYWDWAAVPPAGESVLPASVSRSQTVDVDGPRGVQTIWNPLFSYSFQPLVPAEFPNAPFNQYTSTLRYPTTTDASANSRNDLVANQLDNSASVFRSRLNTLFTSYHDYATWSNEAWINTTDNPMHYDSIESLHDQIHGLTGSGGHMNFIEYSAFDPIFWLHHAMIDRCFAMWQILNPNSYVVDEPARYNSFTTAAGSIQTINSPLTPFHKDASGAFWTAADVYNTSVFGYEYPETGSYTGQNTTANINSAINALYGNGAVVSTSSASKYKSKSKRADDPIDSSVGGTYMEWIANIKVKKYALGCPFFIHIFVGPFDSNPFSWSFEPNLVGTHAVFAQAGICNCDTEQMISATIPLTAALKKHLEAGVLKSLRPTEVNPFLMGTAAGGKGLLQYRISYLNDTEVGNGDPRLRSLDIGVLSAEVSMPSSPNELPVWGQLKGSFDISTGAG